ncbi:DUF4817 domain-containing protein [Trichonephila clavipes]|nr:DUF4817 domain-containing protein [Trichonephila clavipes]
MKPISHSSATGRSGDQKMFLIFAYISCIRIVAVSSFAVEYNIPHLQKEEMVTEFWESNNSDYPKVKDRSIDRKSTEDFSRSSSVLEWFDDSMDEEMPVALQSAPRVMSSFESSHESLLGNSLDKALNLSNYKSKEENDNKIKKISKRDNSVMIPQIRSGISEYLITAPRLGKSNYSIPNSRFKSLNSSIPGPRFYRYNYLIPITRSGKSDVLIPVPRIGRSDYLIPAPRFGTSNYKISVPRVRRSDFLIPTLRLGRSKYSIPVPLFGRSNYLIPIPRVGRSNSLIPVPRVGRSNYLIPVPRVGRSNYLIPVPRVGRSNSLIPAPRVGRSNYLIPVQDRNMNKEILSSFTEVDNINAEDSEGYNAYNFATKRNSDNNGTIIPYPRPGRFAETKSEEMNEFELVDMKRQTNDTLTNDTLIPQIRYGKTDCLVRLWVGGIIGPYFFKNDEGHNVTVNGDRYRAKFTNLFIPELNNQDVQELCFQQDGATCHTARATIDLLKETFGDRLISRFGPVNWPPRSCDLTPLDYFLWSYVKSLVYADKPQTLDHVEDNIRRVIADKRPQMLEKVIENWTSRLDYIRASCGSPMPEIIFKM